MKQSFQYTVGRKLFRKELIACDPVGLFGGTSRAATLNYMCTNYFKNFRVRVYIPLYELRFFLRLFWLDGKEAISEALSWCILLVFLEVKSPQAHLLPSSSHFLVFFFLSIPPSFLKFWAVLTPQRYSTSLSAMFVYIRVPSNNPINARAPSLGPRLTLFRRELFLL